MAICHHGRDAAIESITRYPAQQIFAIKEKLAHPTGFEPVASAFGVQG